MKYGVKVIYTYSVANRKKYYEEMILSVEAESFDKAYEKAEKYAEGYCDEHINPNGELVKTEKIELLDCFLAYDEENDVQELYSAITKNNTSLREEEFYLAFSEQCDAEELYDLRFEEFNREQGKDL